MTISMKDLTAEQAREPHMEVADAASVVHGLLDHMHRLVHGCTPLPLLLAFLIGICNSHSLEQHALVHCDHDDVSRNDIGYDHDDDNSTTRRDI